MKGPFKYEKIEETRDGRGKVISIKPFVSFRISDADDNRIATCYEESNASDIVAALNKAHSLGIA